MTLFLPCCFECSFLAATALINKPVNLRPGVFFSFFFYGEREREGEEGGGKKRRPSFPGMRCREGGYDRRL